jgi:hypothetical protein
MVLLKVASVPSLFYASSLGGPSHRLNAVFPSGDDTAFPSKFEACSDILSLSLEALAFHLLAVHLPMAN